MPHTLLCERHLGQNWMCLHTWLQAIFPWTILLNWFLNPIPYGLFDKPNLVGGRCSIANGGYFWFYWGLVLDVKGKNPKAQPSTLKIEAMRRFWKINNVGKNRKKLKISYLAACDSLWSWDPGWTGKNYSGLPFCNSVSLSRTSRSKWN